MALRKNRQIYSFFLISILLFSCRQKGEVDVSKIDLTINIERFDQDFGKLDPKTLSTQVPVLKQKYGQFYNDYIERMLTIGSPINEGYYSNLQTVLLNPDYNVLFKSVQQKYPDMKKQEEQLTDAFKHVKYYYPKQEIPRLISFISGFTVQTPVGNGYIGIGLDMFLGQDSKFYPALRQSIPLYITRRFTPENITPRVMEVFIREDMFPERDEDRSLMAKMVHNGKIMYCMDAFMPDVADTLKIGYTTQQLEWCKKYEASIWGYFLEQNLLYETDYLKIQKYLAEAPFTPGLGEGNESAPKLGVWIGWQIVNEYMERNPDVTLQQLMKETDPQKILNQSKYKPK